MIQAKKWRLGIIPEVQIAGPRPETALRQQITQRPRNVSRAVWRVTNDKTAKQYSNAKRRGKYQRASFGIVSIISATFTLLLASDPKRVRLPILSQAVLRWRGFHTDAYNTRKLDLSTSEIDCFCPSFHNCIAHASELEKIDERLICSPAANSNASASMPSEPPHNPP